MGRGRAKAKQTKVARELKYSTQNMDYEALQRELSSGQPPAGRSSDERYEDSDDDDDDDRR
ncbi:MAG TPA: DUF3073 domain-containing protein [Pseudonocardiaceae bacterium]|jgi:hypothetical protein